MADQLAPQFTGTYGHPIVQTPNLDALAARGMRFDAAYCNSPLCAPARFAFMAGQLVTKIGAYDNAAEFPASIPTFAHYLRQLGYRTCLTGKMHFVGPDQLHGFEERLTTDVYPSDHVDPQLGRPSRADRQVVPQHGFGEGGRLCGNDVPARIRRGGRLHRKAADLRLRQVSRPAVCDDGQLHPPT